MIYTTMNAIHAHRPSQTKWLKLLVHLGKTIADDEPLGLDVLLASNGLGHALWSLRAVEGHDRAIRRLALTYARHVEHLSNDPLVKACNDVTEKYLAGIATPDELKAAKLAARDAMRAAAWPNPEFAWPAAARAARAAALAAVVVSRDDRAAAGEAAENTLLSVAENAVIAAGAAVGDEYSGDSAIALTLAAEAAEREWQRAEFLKMLEIAV